MKTIDIAGSRYTYDENLLLVIITSLIHKPGSGLCYYDNGLYQKSIGYARKSMQRCRLEMAQIALKVCPGAVYHHKKDVHQNDSGLYHGDIMIYKIGSTSFKHIYHYGSIKPIDEELTLMLSCGVIHAQNLLELLYRKYLIKKIDGTRTTKGLPRCHYPLLHNNVEQDVWEMEYWQSRSSVLIDKVNMPIYYDN
jgi:hypothetical protein